MDVLNNLIVILLVGSLLLLGFIHLTNPMKVNHKGNFLFGLAIFAWSLFWKDEIISLLDINVFLPGIELVVRSIQIVAMPLLYFSTVFYSNPFYRFRWCDSVHLILPVIYTCIQYIKIYSVEPSSLINVLILSIILFQSVFYTFISYLKIRQHRKHLLSFASNNQGVDLIWLEIILVQFILIAVVAAFYSIFSDDQKAGIVINSLNLISSYVVGYASLRQKEIFPIKKGHERELEYLNEKNDEKQPVKRKLMSDMGLKTTSKQLYNVMTVEKPYLDSDLNLMKLADRMGLTPHQLSYTINTGFNQNFFQFVNQYRVEEAKKLLTDGSDENTILAIAFESGFNSKTSFNTTFKKLTGQTPSEYKKVFS